MALLETELSARSSRGTSNRFYRPELDALRFFAFVCVFAAHSISSGGADDVTAWKAHFATIRSFTDCGAFGLCIFFFLSSYLITELLIRERDKTRTVHLKSFYVRRILRIWPLYYLGVLVGLAFSFVAPHRFGLDGKHIFFLVAFLGYLGGTFHSNPIGPLWSISVEELFYFVWPTIIKLGGVRSLIGVSILCVFISLAATMSPLDDWSNPLVQFLFFATGALFAFWARRTAFTLPLGFRAILFGSGLVAWYFSGGNILRVPAILTSFERYAFVDLGCILIFLALFRLPRNFVPSWTIYLGKISYGLYVFHLCCIFTVRFILLKLYPGSIHRAWLMLAVIGLGFGTDVLISALSYRFFERPFLRLKERFTFIPSRAT